MNDMYFSQMDLLWHIFSDVPNATAFIRGSEKYPRIKGVAQFYQQPHGVLVVLEVVGLPTNMEKCKGGIHAVHIHEGEACSGNETDAFADVRMHYNPTACLHPNHAGDLPPIFENEGYSLSVFFTNRFTVNEIIGKTIIVHENIDDFSTQPSGNAGAKIACGKITPARINRK